jgi:uncharacterized protein (DUF2344 family)
MEEIINGLKQIKTRVDSGTITTVNGTETLLSKQLAKMIESAINYTRCCETLPIDKIQEYHIKRWNNALEANISMQETKQCNINGVSSRWFKLIKILVYGIGTGIGTYIIAVYLNNGF